MLGIFNGSITQFDDPYLQSINPQLVMPSRPIVVAVRADSSGTTTAFTQFLNKVAKSLQLQYAVSGQPNWTAIVPNAIPQTGSIGVAKTITQNPYSLGYIDLSDAVTQTLSVASVQNLNGVKIVPSTDSARISLAAANGDYEALGHVDSSLAGAYPITTFTFIVLAKNASNVFSQDDFRASMRYLYWTFTDSYAQRLILRNSYVQLDDVSL